jgi:hypothetical protein
VARVQCFDCDMPVVVDPNGRCPEGHDLGPVGERIEQSLGRAEPHPDEPQPWVAILDADEVEPAPQTPAPRPVRPISIGPEPSEAELDSGSADGLLQELHALHGATNLLTGERPGGLSLTSFSTIEETPTAPGAAAPGEHDPSPASASPETGAPSSDAAAVPAATQPWADWDDWSDQTDEVPAGTSPSPPADTGEGTGQQDDEPWSAAIPQDAATEPTIDAPHDTDDLTEATDWFEHTDQDRFAPGSLDTAAFDAETSEGAASEGAASEGAASGGGATQALPSDTSAADDDPTPAPRRAPTVRSEESMSALAELAALLGDDDGPPAADHASPEPAAGHTPVEPSTPGPDATNAGPDTTSARTDTANPAPGPTSSPSAQPGATSPSSPAPLPPPAAQTAPDQPAAPDHAGDRLATVSQLPVRPRPFEGDQAPPPPPSPPVDESTGPGSDQVASGETIDWANFTAKGKKRRFGR